MFYIKFYFSPWKDCVCVYVCVDVLKSKMSRNRDFWLIDYGLNQVFFLFDSFFIAKKCDGLMWKS